MRSAVFCADVVYERNNRFRVLVVKLESNLCLHFIMRAFEHNDIADIILAFI